MRKNTAATRNYQAFITRYNVYYNGDTHYKETLHEMEESYEDDFTRLLPMHPAEAHGKDAAHKPMGSFTRSIEKAQKAIQLRSIKRRPRRTPGKRRDIKTREWLKREEYNPFIHNAWMLLGRSRYMNGDFLGAASTFMYVTRHFNWLPETVTEALLWQARSYCAAGWVHEAEATIGRVKEKAITNSNLTGLKAFVEADIAIATGNYPAAISPLRIAVEHSSGAQRTRLTYLLGQILQLTGDNEGAYHAFAKVSSGFSTPFRYKFNAQIQQCASAPVTEAKKELKTLRRMTRYSRNSEYLDQIHYAEGNLLLALGDTAQAVRAYSRAVEKSERRGIDMAIASLALGKLYYTMGDYEKAQPCYAEAVTLLPQEYQNFSSVKQTSDILDELLLHLRNVNEQDSLLMLADLSRQEQLAVIQKKIDNLKAADAAEYEQEQDIEQVSETQIVAPSIPILTTDKSWYFYNNAVRNAGAAEFRRRWGGRKLEDNWRRRNKNEYATLSDDETIEEETEIVNNVEAEYVESYNDPYSPEYYLKNIPSTNQQRQDALAIIREGLYNSGLILKDKLNDYSAAMSQWHTLLTRFPDNEYRLDTYYNIYLMLMREDRHDEAEKYRRLITIEFPESSFGQAMRNPDYLDNLRKMPQQQEIMYEHALSSFISNHNTEVRQIVDSIRSQYPLSPLMPRFLFLEALTFAGDGDIPTFKYSLKKLIEKYPDAEAAPLASDYLKGLRSGRQVQSGGDNSTTICSTRMLVEGSGVEENIVEDADTIRFNFDNEVPHVLMIAFNKDSINPNEVLYEVARFNFNTFSVRDFELEPLEFGNLGVLIVRGLANADEAARYKTMISDASGAALPHNVMLLIVSEENLRTILTYGLTLKQYIHAQETAVTKSVHEAVLPPDKYLTEEELYSPTDMP